MKGHLYLFTIVVLFTSFIQPSGQLYVSWAATSPAVSTSRERIMSGKGETGDKIIIRIIRIKRIKLYNASTTWCGPHHCLRFTWVTKNAFNLNQVAKELFVREDGWPYIETGAKSKNWRRHEVGQWPSIKQLRRHKVIFAWLGLDLSNQRPDTGAPEILQGLEDNCFDNPWRLASYLYAILSVMSGSYQLFCSS